MCLQNKNTDMTTEILHLANFRQLHTISALQSLHEYLGLWFIYNTCFAYK